MKQKVAAIVPAYNEEKRIADVVKTLIRSRLFSEVICVNDASTDDTKRIIKSFPEVTLIDLSVNMGKAHAICKGVAAANSDIVMFVDADLVGLSNGVFRALTKPLLSGEYDVTIGYPSKVEDVTLFRPLTGERCYFRKDLLPYLGILENKGYGLELALNYLFRNERVKIVVMKGVSQLHKLGKYPAGTALLRELVTWKQLLREVSKQDNPLRFAYGAYLKNFYFQPSELREEDVPKASDGKRVA